MIVDVPTPPLPPMFLFGLSPFEFLTVAATGAGIIIGPVIAYFLGRYASARDKERDGRLQLLRQLITSQGTPYDPLWTMAFNAVPIEFNRCKRVTVAWKAVLHNLNVTPTPENRVFHEKDVSSKITAMLFEMTRLLNIDITEGELASEGYLAIGVHERETLWRASLQATCDIATAQKEQLQIIRGLHGQG